MLTISTSSTTDYVQVGQTGASFSTLTAGHNVLVIGTPGSTTNSIDAQVVSIAPSRGSQHRAPCRMAGGAFGFVVVAGDVVSRSIGASSQESSGPLRRVAHLAA